MKPSLRPVWAEVDLGAVRANIEALRNYVAPVPLLAVVKADGYGHGAEHIAKAAVQAGATMLGVALVEEGIALREGGIEIPILVLSQPVADAADAIIEYALTPAVYTRGGIDALADAARRAGAANVAVHLKIDSGMHRVGCDQSVALELAQCVVEHEYLTLAGVWTHCAVADEEHHPYNELQLQRFDNACAVLAAHGIVPAMRHMANTAAAIGLPAMRFDLVRCGIGIYGVAPAAWIDQLLPLTPALSVHASVSYVKRLSAGEAMSYGLRYSLSRDATIATIPVGYADGVPRLLGERGGEVLIRGKRHRIAGTITMDQILVDVGDEPVEIGEPVVLIGIQGAESITADEWAEHIGTIGYEIVCGFAKRVPRRYLNELA